MNYYELTNSQRMIWIGQLMNPESPQYNMAFSFEFRHGIDPPSFKRAFEKLIATTDVLRSSFHVLDGEPKMLVKDEIRFDLEVLEMSREEWEVWKKQETSRPFKVEESVFVSKLIHLTSGEFIWYLNQHHLITDGWAFALLYERMAKFYRSEDSNSNDQAHFNFQPFTIDEKSLDRKLEHWSEVGKREISTWQFNGNSNDNLLPSSQRIRSKLPLADVVELRDMLGKGVLRLWSIDLALFTFFSTVVLATINKLSHSKLIAIGAPALNRINAVQKKTIGLFIEMFPLEAEISTGESYESLYKKLSLSANNFLRYSGSGASNPELNKRFNVVLNYINASFVQYDGFDAKSDWIHPDASDPGHHIRIQITDFDQTGAIHIYFDMNEAVFNDTQKSEFIETFHLQIERFKRDPSSLINPNEEIELKQIADFNQTGVGYPSDLTYLDLFNDQVTKNPKQVAVFYEGKSLTFRELDEKSNQMAHYLLDSGVSKEDAVGILQDRSLNLMISLLGVNKAGAAYVPIDLTFPAERIDYIKKDAEIRLLIGEDFDWSKLDDYPSLPCQVAVSPADLIYIIYTSGSTGEPKGVMNQHSGVFNRLYWAKEEFNLSANDSLLQKTNYTFDVSVGELFLPLISGCRLVLAKRGGHRDSDYLKHIIDQEKITSVHFVPPMLEIFLLSLKKGDCPSLKFLLCSGEALKPSQVNAFRAIFPKTELYNLYGPTEAAIEVSKWIAPREGHVDLVTIGKMLPNVKFRIVDDQENQLSFLVPGELWIGGVQVARGYKNKDSLTQERFISRDGIRWYRTGDLCQWRRNGEVEYLGRIDNQVKVRGYRVELGEIEHAIKSHDNVSEVVVLVKNQGILAFIVAPEETDMVSFLAEKLPSYMIPSQITFIDSIPYMNNGKINRQSLLNLEKSSPEIIRPRNEFEDFVYGIWCTVLGKEEIDIFDDFFTIGGDSLSGIRVITSINAELDLDFPVVLIFQRTTIADLAIEIESEIDKRLEEA